MRAKIIAISIATLIPLYPNLSSGPIMATVTADSVIRPTLTINSKGGLVEDLHSTLRLLGYYSGPITNVYDQNTFTAVALFQKVAGLPETGTMDNQSWNVLLPIIPPSSTSSATSVETSPPPVSKPSEPILREGNSGESVRELQRQLVRLGFLPPGTVDGRFGSMTENAVLAAQTKYRLSVDGVVGPATWRALRRN